MSAPHVPPQNLEAEESVIGAMLLSPSVVTAVADVLRPHDFYREESHGRIFQAILDLDAKGEPVDAITLTDFLEERGELAKIGGKAKIHELAALVPATSNAGHYAKIVREMSVLRNLQKVGSEITRLGSERPGEIEELIAHAEKMVATLSDHATAGDFEAIGSELRDLYLEIAHAVETGEQLFGLRTGFHDLDEVLTGLHPGQMIVIAARPSVGKSMLAQNITENVVDAGTPAAFFSLEMSKRELQLRAAVRESSLDLSKLRTGRLTPPELMRFKEACTKIAARKMYVEDNASITMTELRSRARRLKQTHGLGLLVVDYLQLMVSQSKSDNRQAEVAQISRQLKVLAKELHIPIIVISQLSRKTETREDKRPILSDLRESGAIEQDADVVIFLYRESLYTQVDVTVAAESEIIIAKNRMGQVTDHKLLFHGRRQSFLNPAPIGAANAA